MLVRLAFLSVLLSVLPPPQAPDSATPAPVAMIDRLVANAEQFHATLPSLTADETISSHVAYMSMFKRSAEAQGTFRVVRKMPEGKLEESRQITILNGKAVEPGKRIRLPATLFGGFGSFQEMFFTPEHRRCFAFTLLPQPGRDGTLQIAISSIAEMEAQPGCKADRHNLTGLARVDPATGQLTHLERTVPDEIARKTVLAPFASVDCAPAKVGNDTFWLPTEVVGRILNGNLRGEFIAHYSNYHRYTASITLLPGATEVDPDAAPEPAASTPR